ncbi:MAG: hypothetical protein JWR42_2371 [Marmoricola sp.]|nr:hypothetical protein [Marmoricola sp.]
MFAPGLHTEGETLAGYLADQLQALRTSAHGLTDDQARATPTRSALSIGGLVKHATYVLGGRERRRAGQEITPETQALFTGSFTLTEDETLAGVLEAYDAAVADYLAEVRSVDPAAESIEPAAPWHGIDHPTPVHERHVLVHHVEELARHAGHADIIREQLDGATALSLRFAELGLPGNAFVTPWSPDAP